MWRSKLAATRVKDRVRAPPSPPRFRPILSSVGPRALLLLLAVVAAAGGWVTVQARGAAGPEDGAPVTVGTAPIEATALETVALRTAGKHADRLPEARL